MASRKVSNKRQTINKWGRQRFENARITSENKMEQTTNQHHAPDSIWHKICECVKSLCSLSDAHSKCLSLHHFQWRWGFLLNFICTYCIQFAIEWHLSGGNTRMCSRKRRKLKQKCGKHSNGCLTKDKYKYSEFHLYKWKMNRKTTERQWTDGNGARLQWRKWVYNGGERKKKR